MNGGASFGKEVLIASDPAYANAARPTIAARDEILSFFKLRLASK